MYNKANDILSNVTITNVDKINSYTKVVLSRQVKKLGSSHTVTGIFIVSAQVIGVSNIIREVMRDYVLKGLPIDDYSIFTAYGLIKSTTEIKKRLFDYHIMNIQSAENMFTTKELNSLAHNLLNEIDDSKRFLHFIKFKEEGIGRPNTLSLQSRVKRDNGLLYKTISATLPNTLNFSTQNTSPKRAFTSYLEILATTRIAQKRGDILVSDRNYETTVIKSLGRFVGERNIMRILEDYMYYIENNPQRYETIMSLLGRQQVIHTHNFVKQLQ